MSVVIKGVLVTAPTLASLIKRIQEAANAD